MRRRRVLACALMLAVSSTLVGPLMVRVAVPAPPRPATRSFPPQQPPRPPQPPPPPQPAPALGSPFANLTAAELARWTAGKASFLTVDTPPAGLGPVFTENACSVCHSAGALGGAGARLVTHFGRFVSGQFDPMTEFGGPQVQDRGIGLFNGVNFVGEVVPPEATVVTQHRTAPVFGLGLVDAVPDAVFVSIAQHQAAFSPETAGQVSFVTDPATALPRVGKFGWKAQEPTVFAFAGDAYVNELGVTTPLFPDENSPQGNSASLAANPATSNPNEPDNDDLQAFTDFITFMAPPPRGPVGPKEQAGAMVFAVIGCAGCHLPSLQTGPSPTKALNNVTFAPYSDFLLHDMGSLGDGIVQNQAGPRAMRTAPLWGLRFQPSLLHDGRAANVDQAVRAHDGQAEFSRDLYLRMGDALRDQLQAFLNSL